MPFGDNILAMHLTEKYQAPIRRTLCPVCWYPLEDTERGLHCVDCGWSEHGVPQKYIPRTPDMPQS